MPTEENMLELRSLLSRTTRDWLKDHPEITSGFYTLLIVAKLEEDGQLTLVPASYVDSELRAHQMALTFLRVYGSNTGESVHPDDL